MHGNYLFVDIVLLCCLTTKKICQNIFKREGQKKQKPFTNNDILLRDKLPRFVCATSVGYFSFFFCIFTAVRSWS